MSHPASKALAKRYVADFLSRGYTVEKAQAEICMGMGGPDQPGYEIRHGKIECPAFSGNVFSFADLAAELRREEVQGDLFR